MKVNGNDINMHVKHGSSIYSQVVWLLSKDATVHLNIKLLNMPP